MNFPEKIPVTLEVGGAARHGWKAVFVMPQGMPPETLWHLDGFPLDVLSHNFRDMIGAFANQIPYAGGI